MGSATELYEELVADYLTRPGVTLGKALQNEVLKVNNKIFAFRKDDRLVVKVPAEQAAALVRNGRAAAFTSGGRTMREWVAVGPTDLWPDLIEDAHAYVSRI
jgi:hypothetical protein